MSAENFNILITVIATAAISLNVVYLTVLLYRAKKRTGEFVSIDPVREKIEGRVYDQMNVLTSNDSTYRDVNHLLLSYSSKDMVLKQQVADYSYFEELGIDLTTIQVQKNFAVCLMPFHKRYDKLYTAIKNACKQSGFVSVRSDDKFVSGDILKYTIELILQAQIIIAVIDGRNPNVFYEIGMAHSLGKPVILVSNMSESQSVPFDVRNKRLVMYNGANDLEERLSYCINSFKENSENNDKH